MNNLFTHEIKATEKKIRASLSEETCLSPQNSTLEFIKSFARNFRVDKDAEPSIQGFILN